MTDYKFNSVEELYRKLKPALEAKVSELKRNKIDYIKEPPLFDVGGKHRVSSWLCHPNAPKVEMPEQLKTRIENMKRKGNVVWVKEYPYLK